jgi:hypothetical protein
MNESTNPLLRRLRLAQWLVIPLAVAVGVELGMRRWIRNKPVLFWDHVQQVADEGPIDFLFIGSSRTAAAIDEDAFAEAASARLGRPVRAVNVGMGWSQLPQHWMGLRNLLERRPDALRGATVFLEAPALLPMHARWDGPWYLPGREDLLIQVGRPADLPGLWNSPATLEGKLGMTFRMLTANSAACKNCERMGARIRERAREIVRDTSATLGQAARGLTPTDGFRPAADLRSAGGIRTDEEAVAGARELAHKVAAETLAAQGPWRDWDETVLADIVDLAVRGGARVVFYEMPLHSLQARVEATPLRDEDRILAAGWLADRGLPMLRPDFRTADDDFPDIWHLRGSAAPAFSRAVLEAWLAHRRR